MTVPQLLSFIVAFLGGLALGLVYLGLLRASIRLFLLDRRPGLAAVLTVSRLLLVAAGLWASVQFGSVALLATFAGFTVLRALAGRKTGEPSWT